MAVIMEEGGAVMEEGVAAVMEGEVNVEFRMMHRKSQEHMCTWQVRLYMRCTLSLINGCLCSAANMSSAAHAVASML